jgi:O-antigen/teichoic acid export membrane protein
MGSRLLWRRSATAAGLYAAVLLGVLGTIVAARVLGPADFGIFATVTATAALFQVLLDLTVEESLTKYGFRYTTAADWGRLRRLFRKALEVKLVGGALAAVAILVLAPFADAIFGVQGLAAPLAAIAALPLVQAPENVAATALLLRGRYDLRAALGTLSMGLRLLAIVIGTQLGLTETMVAIVLAQALATGTTCTLGAAAFRRFPAAPARELGEDRREIVSFVARSSVATGMLSLRTALAPLLLGVVAGPTAVGLLRIAQAPQTGLAAASSPVRLILLTEQTRDWERGKPQVVLAGVRRYMRHAGLIMVVAVPVFFVLMPWLVRVVFGADYLDAVDAARLILFAAALQLVFGWTKSLPVTIGRPGLRIVTHGVETAVLLPLVVVCGDAWGVTGAGLAILVSTVVFVALWAVLLVRLHGEVAARSGAAGGREALVR